MLVTLTHPEQSRLLQVIREIYPDAEVIRNRQTTRPVQMPAYVVHSRSFRDRSGVVSEIDANVSSGATIDEALNNGVEFIEYLRDLRNLVL